MLYFRSQNSSYLYFFIVHAIESYLQINSNKSIEDLSPQQITSCTPNTLTCGGGGGCEGAVVPLAWSYTERFGLVKEADYPYDSGNVRITIKWCS